MRNTNKEHNVKERVLEGLCNISTKVFESSNDRCMLGFLYEPKVDSELYIKADKKDEFK